MDFESGDHAQRAVVARNGTVMTTACGVFQLTVQVGGGQIRLVPLHVCGGVGALAVVVVVVVGCSWVGGQAAVPVHGWLRGTLGSLPAGRHGAGPGRA